MTIRLRAALILSCALATAGCSSSSGAGSGASSGSSAASSTTTSAGPAPAATPFSVSAATLHVRLPVPTSRPAVVVQGGRVVVAGGLVGHDSSTDAVFSLDPARKTLTRVGTLAQPVHDAAAVTGPGTAYVVGGGESAVSAAVLQIPGSDTGRTAGRLPAPRADVVSATVGGASYVVGGYDGSQNLASVLRTTDGLHYTAVAQLPKPVRYPAVAAVGSALYVFGGERGGRLTDAVQRIDLTTGRATLLHPLPQPLGHAGAVVMGGRILLLGGKTGITPADRETDRVVAYDPTIGRTTAMAPLPRPMSDFGVAVVGGTAYLVGGEHGRPLDTIVALRSRGGQP